VCGADDEATQLLVHAANALLGNVGTTIDLDRPSLQKAGDDAAVARLVDDMNRGDIDVLVLYGVNPAYDYPEADRFNAGMAKVPLTISFGDRLDETTARAHAVCPDHHFLEAWGDAEPVRSCFSLAQPTIAPLFETRAAQDSLLKWLGRGVDFYEYLRGFWRESIHQRHARGTPFDDFWDRSLHDGVFAPAPGAPSTRSFAGDCTAAAAAVVRDHAAAAKDSG